MASGTADLEFKVANPGETKASTGKLVDVAENPFLKVGKELTKLEMLALASSTAATGAASFGLDFYWQQMYGESCPLAVKASVLPLVGIVAEKPWFFAPFVYKELKKRRSLPKEDRKGRWHHFKRGMKEGFPVFRADVLFHDPFYGASYVALKTIANPQTAIGDSALAVAAFFMGLGFATTAEVKLNDYQHRRFSNKLAKAGFEREPYFEAKYLVDPRRTEHTPESVLQEVQEEFDLPHTFHGFYDDIYFDQDEEDEVFNGMKSYLRFRRRPRHESEMRTIQVILTRAGEIFKQDENLWRCFPISKEKFYYMIPEEWDMPTCADEVPDEKVRKVVKKFERSGGAYKRVQFHRSIVYDPKTLLVTTDLGSNYQQGEPFWIEAKVRDDLRLLKNANDFIAMNYPVRATTYRKFDFAKLNGD